MDFSSLGAIIPKRRQALGLSRPRLARVNGFSRQTLANLEPSAPGDLGGVMSARSMVRPSALHPPALRSELPRRFEVPHEELRDGHM